MKKLYKILSLLLCLLFITSCTMSLVDNIDRTLPESKPLDLEMYWKYFKSVKIPNTELKTLAITKSYYASITRDEIKVDDLSLKKPMFKGIIVDTDSFLATRYNLNKGDLGVLTKSMNIYTATDNKGQLVRILKIDDQTIGIDKGNAIDILTISSKNEFDSNISTKPTNDKKITANGVLVGIRYDRENESGDVLIEPRYETYWIAMTKSGELTIKKMKNLIFPRNNFNLIKVDSQQIDGKTVESLVYQNIDGEKKYIRQLEPPKGLNRFIDITFLSNDYISFKETESDERKAYPMKRYKTYKVDNLDTESSARIDEVAGQEGKKALESAAREKIKDIVRFGTDLNKGLDYNSFILRRDVGKWIYEGRVIGDWNFSESKLKFSMNIPNNYLIYRHDALSSTEDVETSVNALKSINKNMEDAIASPDKLFTIIKVNNTLNIHKKNVNGIVEKDPVEVVTLPKNGQIVMHEWATNMEFVNWWSEIVDKIDY